jgi:hypothetical protein
MLKKAGLIFVLTYDLPLIFCMFSSVITDTFLFSSTTYLYLFNKLYTSLLFFYLWCIYTDHDFSYILNNVLIDAIQFESKTICTSLTIYIPAYCSYKRFVINEPTSSIYFIHWSVQSLQPNGLNTNYSKIVRYIRLCSSHLQYMVVDNNWLIKTDKNFSIKIIKIII